MRLILCSIVVALAAPVAAYAGPVSSGLAHTEWVERKRAEAAKAAEKPEPLRLRAPTACLSQAEAALTADPGVRSVARWGDTFVVHVHDKDGATAPALQRVIDGVCGAGASVS